MKRKMRRMLALALAFVMTFGVFAGTGITADAAGTPVVWSMAVSTPSLGSEGGYVTVTVSGEDLGEEIWYQVRCCGEDKVYSVFKETTTAKTKSATAAEFTVEIPKNTTNEQLTYQIRVNEKEPAGPNWALNKTVKVAAGSEETPSDKVLCDAKTFRAKVEDEAGNPVNGVTFIADDGYEPVELVSANGIIEKAVGQWEVNYTYTVTLKDGQDWTCDDEHTFKQGGDWISGASLTLVNGKTIEEAGEIVFTLKPAEVKPEVNTKDLEDEIFFAESKKAADYTPESFKVLTDALAAAKAVLADENKTQDSVDAAAKTLKDARLALVEAEKIPVTEGYTIRIQVLFEDDTKVTEPIAFTRSFLGTTSKVYNTKGVLESEFYPDENAAGTARIYYAGEPIVIDGVEYEVTPAEHTFTVDEDASFPVITHIDGKAIDGPTEVKFILKEATGETPDPTPTFDPAKFNIKVVDEEDKAVEGVSVKLSDGVENSAWGDYDVEIPGTSDENGIISCDANELEDLYTEMDYILALADDSDYTSDDETTLWFEEGDEGFYLGYVGDDEYTEETGDIIFVVSEKATEPPVPTVDKTALAAAIKKAGGYYESGYSSARWEVFQAALTEAEAVNKNADATQDEVDAATKALNDAIGQLKYLAIFKVTPSPAEPTSKGGEVEITVTGEYLDTHVWYKLQEKPEGGYYSDVAGYSKLSAETVEEKSATFKVTLPENTGETAITYRVQVMGKEPSYSWTGAASVELVVPAPSAAPVVDKTELAAAISEAENIPSGDYTDDSIATLADALDDARAVNANEDATQEEVDEALANLQAAIDGLEEKPVEPPVVVNPFVDVTEGAFYYDAVLWAVGEDITTGTSATTFSPNASCTRGQVVTFLWRANGCPEPKSTANPFKDVQAGQFYTDAVLWAVEEGITTGTSATTFSPNKTVTRSEFVTFLWRSEGRPAPTVNNPFTDVKAGQFYTDAVLWAVEEGITTGTSATTFSPNNSCMRGEVVTFLYRTLGGRVL